MLPARLHTNLPHAWTHLSCNHCCLTNIYTYNAYHPSKCVQELILICLEDTNNRHSITKGLTDYFVDDFDHWPSAFVLTHVRAGKCLSHKRQLSRQF